ncbi:MotA/TolQ/ExbB proton channel family protein [Gammaproteobacteria bacterium]|nr:MotA/TolQ/ExbB proton channel family protein [Gammaproteobacteria bacterium]
MNDYTIAFFDYMQRGGDVLWGILVLTVILWWFVLERGWYFLSGFAEDRDTRLQQWLDRPERSSWYANYERDRLISELECLMMKNMQVIPTFIALLPLMGLLGTVTGMVQVFDVMANLGSGNPRAMANGVSAATLPTMSGMLVAIIAIPFWTLLDRRYKSEVAKLRELMVEE